MEVLTFTLCSREENFDMLNRTQDVNKAVIIANPRTSEFEVTRICSSLLDVQCSSAMICWILNSTCNLLCSWFHIFSKRSVNVNLSWSKCSIGKYPRQFLCSYIRNFYLFIQAKL